MDAHRNRGQALVELLACLFGMLFVILGILAFTALGVAGIKNQISARKGADENAIMQIASAASGTHITEWKNPDGLKFTADDAKNTSGYPVSEIFMNELTDTGGTFSTALLDAANYSDAAFDSKVELSNFFLSAAGLTSRRETVSDPFGIYGHFDLKRMLRSFGFPAEFMIEDTVYMPLPQNSN